MTRNGKIRLAAWLVFLSSMAVFLIIAKATPSGPISTLGLTVTFLPHQIGSIALLVLFWVGGFPESWPLIGGSRWFGRILCCVFAVFLVTFWAFFYARFVFHIA